MRVCEQHGCGKEFEPYKRGKPQRFCSKECREAAWHEQNPGRHKTYAKKWNDANKSHLRWAAIKSNYGLTREQWDAMLIAQCGRCDICLRPLVKPVVDHSHVTDKVRSLLCYRCNAGLAGIEDEQFRPAALAYLEKHRG